MGRIDEIWNIVDIQSLATDVKILKNDPAGYVCRVLQSMKRITSKSNKTLLKYRKNNATNIERLVYNGIQFLFIYNPSEICFIVFIFKHKLFDSEQPIIFTSVVI